MKSYSQLLVIYILTISLWGFLQMGYDKWQAQKNRWRVPEKSLFLTAALGGAFGVIMGMHVFRHKTMHKKFVIGILILCLLNVAGIVWILFK